MHPIELTEIEKHLSMHHAVKEVIVIAKKQQLDRVLCAYILGSTNEKELRKYLSEIVPFHMIPDFFIFMESFPLTKNGKIDRQALLNNALPQKNKQRIDPQNLIQEKLIKIWKMVLQVEEIGIRDSFFELGGSSFKAMQVIVQIRKEFDVPLELRDIFNEPTVEDISQLIEAIDWMKKTDNNPENNDGEVIVL
ncbi:MAG: hypothetical protein OMM_04959 [Candidatus Magnetoglobus multicellularis str. Araruama]|uniref:Carrier domain-containing protein n=1 Tax=Candidatus Magnetoglobus multicellularis str. Araruama TaxID=890399 RepID=A0A1V1NYY8_9BACT|nr:MAG: hypothetical protein OMM_04959 [Candidatus Magnetoglobus multicellularis str. Araruama]